MLCQDKGILNGRVFYGPALLKWKSFCFRRPRKDGVRFQKIEDRFIEWRRERPSIRLKKSKVSSESFQKKARKFIWVNEVIHQRRSVGIEGSGSNRG